MSSVIQRFSEYEVIGTLGLEIYSLINKKSGQLYRVERPFKLSQNNLPEVYFETPCATFNISFILSSRNRGL